MMQQQYCSCGEPCFFICKYEIDDDELIKKHIYKCKRLIIDKKTPCNFYLEENIESEKINKVINNTTSKKIDKKTEFDELKSKIFETANIIRFKIELGESVMKDMSKIVAYSYRLKLKQFTPRRESFDEFLERVRKFDGKRILPKKFEPVVYFSKEQFDFLKIHDPEDKSIKPSGKKIKKNVVVFRTGDKFITGENNDVNDEDEDIEVEENEDIENEYGIEDCDKFSDCGFSDTEKGGLDFDF